jgi:hypothetical protein
MRVAIIANGIATNGMNQSDDVMRLMGPRQLKDIASTPPVAAEHISRTGAQGRVFLSVLIRYLRMPQHHAAPSAGALSEPRGDYRKAKIATGCASSVGARRQRHVRLSRFRTRKRRIVRRNVELCMVWGLRPWQRLTSLE